MQLSRYFFFDCRIHSKLIPKKKEEKCNQTQRERQFSKDEWKKDRKINECKTKTSISTSQIEYS